MPLVTRTRGFESSGELDLELRDILDLVSTTFPSKDALWRLLHLEARGVLSDDNLGNMVDLETRIASTVGGVTLAWRQLVTMSRELEDVWNVRVEGTVGQERLLIDLFDSTVWTVEANDARYLDPLKRLGFQPR